ncbi:DgyrCDS3162 [Dimorphilus gyrociliatus]|uniref:DgyrCDS3162 n=1 Tax=Dimorphilus gyrociliatus TaxID=2664684 RepID=A0A7I8VE47_9ANNE|nr:DgyrCDS3162 [Dimorphilus gyrociliatus]
MSTFYKFTFILNYVSMKLMTFIFLIQLVSSENIDLLGKPVKQSGKNRILFDGVLHKAELAIDGDETDGGDFKSCMNAEPDGDYKWLMIDLESVYNINKVNLVLRECCFDHYRELFIRLYTKPPEKWYDGGDLCKHFKIEKDPPRKINISCDNPVSGRYVAISMNYKLPIYKNLQLCEVYIDGTLTGNSVKQATNYTPKIARTTDRLSTSSTLTVTPVPTPTSTEKIKYSKKAEKECSSQDSCGLRCTDTVEPSGLEAVPNSWPFLAAIFQRTPYLRYICAATIISHKWLITSANCFEGDLKSENYIVLVGVTNTEFEELNFNQKEHEINRFVSQPEFPEKTDNGTVLIELKEDLMWNQQIRRICLSPQKPSKADKCFQVGWGSRFLNLKGCDN